MELYSWLCVSLLVTIVEEPKFLCWTVRLMHKSKQQLLKCIIFWLIFSLIKTRLSQSVIVFVCAQRCGVSQGLHCWLLSIEMALLIQLNLSSSSHASVCCHPCFLILHISLLLCKELIFNSLQSKFYHLFKNCSWNKCFGIFLRLWSL